MPDPYETLCVPRTATQAEIQTAYRRLARAHHPDHGGDAEKFRAVAASYAVLGDPEARARFDQTGEAPGAPFDWSVFSDLFTRLFGSGEQRKSGDVAAFAQVLGRIAEDAREAASAAGDVANLLDLVREVGVMGVEAGLSPDEDDDADAIHLRAGLVALLDWARGGSGESPLQERAPRAERRRKTKARR